MELLTTPLLKAQVKTEKEQQFLLQASGGE